MPMKVKKAVIPAAGLGTRVLPATKAVPKEMLPIVDKPAIQYIVEECVKAGIDDILIVISRGKSVIEDHFDRSPELERRLSAGNKTEALADIKNIAEMANITYVRQQEQLGLGHAVLCARNFAGAEPFAVLYGDDVIIGEDPAIAQLCRAYEKHGRGVVGIKEVSEADIAKYSSMKLKKMEDGCYFIDDMVEKPKPGRAFSNFSILGRCVLPPQIWEILKRVPPGAGGELQLTDAMKILANRDGMTGVDFTGTRYDMGAKLGIMKAAIEVGLKHKEIGAQLKDYIKELAESLK
jgi:UTP--glucose-1-phosphate uridylyltransferase